MSLKMYGHGYYKFVVRNSAPNVDSASICTNIFSVALKVIVVCKNGGLAGQNVPSDLFMTNKRMNRSSEKRGRTRARTWDWHLKFKCISQI